MSTSIRNTVFFGIVASQILLDQISKYWVRANVDEGSWTELMGTFLLMTKVENEGAMLSMGSNLPPVLHSILMIWLPIIMILGVMAYVMLRRNQFDLISIGLCFVAGGGIGNIIDRMLYGSVTDFLIMGWDFARTGIFNLADLSVMIGVGMILVGSLIEGRREKALQQASEAIAEQ